jgi:hypothetical protein
VGHGEATQGNPTLDGEKVLVSYRHIDKCASGELFILSGQDNGWRKHRRKKANGKRKISE